MLAESKSMSQSLAKYRAERAAAKEAQAAQDRLPHLMRSAPDRFETPTDLPQGVWFDKKTGLSWLACPMFMRDSNTGVCSYNEKGVMDWWAAVALAQVVRLGGHADWRLPTHRDFLTLGWLENAENNACINQVFLFNGSWTSTLSGRQEEDAWTDGKQSYTGKGGLASCTPLSDRYMNINGPTSKISDRQVILVRGGVPDPEWQSAIEDPKVQARLASRKKLQQDREAALSKLTTNSTGVAVSHRILAMNPEQLSESLFHSGGSMDELDWFVNGLRELNQSNPKIKNTLADYLRKTRLFQYSADFSSPFDKQEFEEKLALEKQSFLDKIFSYTPAKLPTSFVTFTPVLLEDYNFDTGILKLSKCGAVDTSTAGRILNCGVAGVDIPYGKLEGKLQGLSSDGELVRTNRIRFVKFQTFFGGGNTGAPVFILQHGMPSSVSLVVPKEQAKQLYELAKTTPKPGLGMDSKYNGRLLSAKVLYSAPKLLGFGASNKVEQSLFMTFTSGATVNYIIKPVAVCIFDGTGRVPVFCEDLKL